MINFMYLLDTFLEPVRFDFIQIKREDDREWNIYSYTQQMDEFCCGAVYLIIEYVIEHYIDTMSCCSFQDTNLKFLQLHVCDVIASILQEDSRCLKRNKYTCK